MSDRVTKRRYKKRKELDELLERIETLEALAPTAGAAHARLAALKDELTRERHKFFGIWVRAEQYEEWNDSLKRLELTLRGVERLAGEAAEIQSELEAERDGIQDRIHELYSGIPDWVSGAVDRWRRQLLEVGSTAHRPQDLSEDEAELRRVHGAMLSIEAAVDGLDQARQLLEQLEEGIRTAHSEAGVRKLRDEFWAAAPGDDWRARLAEQLDSLRELQRPPAELQNVSAAVAKVEAWVEQFPDFQEAYLAMRDHKGHLLGSWRGDESSEELQSLEREVAGLLERILEHARAERSARLRTLWRLLENLERESRPVESVPTGLDGHDRAELQNPREHKEWMLQIDEKLRRVRNKASAGIFDLRSKLRERASELRTRLARLRSRDLPDVSDDIDRLDQKIGGLGGEDDLVDAVLEELATASDCADDITRLEDAADLVAAKLNERTASLRRRAQRVVAAAERIKLQLNHSLVSEAGDEGSLEERRRRADALEESLVAEEAHVLEHCKDVLRQHQAAIREAASVLAAVPGMSLVEEPAAAGVPDDPEAAVDTVQNAERRRSELLRMVDEKLEGLEKERHAGVAALEAMLEGELGSDDRTDAEELLQSLQDVEDVPAGTPLERLRRLAHLIDGYRQFRERLDRERLDYQRGRSALQRRMRSFRTDGLERHVGAEVTRAVRGLVVGLPEAPEPLGDAVQQLDEALRAFTRLESRAKRNQALSIRRDAEALRKNRLGDLEAAQLVEQIEEAGRRGEVPSRLRLQLDRFVRRLPPELSS